MVKKKFDKLDQFSPIKQNLVPRATIGLTYTHSFREHVYYVDGNLHKRSSWF